MTLGVGEQGTPTTKLSYMFLYFFYSISSYNEVHTINLKIYYIHILKKKLEDHMLNF